MGKKRRRRRKRRLKKRSMKRRYKVLTKMVRFFTSPKLFLLLLVLFTSLMDWH